MADHRNDRRDFLKGSAAIGAGLFVANGSAFADDDKDGKKTVNGDIKSPNNKLNLAAIGSGGKGKTDITNCQKENIVALCDVDMDRAKETIGFFPKAKVYHDYRLMLDEMGDKLDGVTISTPDHHHAPAASRAMRMGLHVYVQKPLTHTIAEVRHLHKLSKECKCRTDSSRLVATQMGNQGTSEYGLRRAVDAIRAGAIGPVKELHVWTNRPVWPQGIERPKDTPPVPNGMDWYLWLGPAADRPYNPAYAPFKWRGWWDWGTGALGDMGCHTLNMPFMALDLGYPTSVDAKSDNVYAETAPLYSQIVYEFPARGDKPPVKFTWYDGTKNGGAKPPKSLVKGYVDDYKKFKYSGSGALLVGSEGIMYADEDYGKRWKLLPREKFSGWKTDEVLPRSPGHYAEWLNACKGGTPAMANFDYSCPLTETVVVGNLAVRLNKKVEWDAKNMRSPNCPEAEALIHKEYRKGFELI